MLVQLPPREEDARSLAPDETDPVSLRSRERVANPNESDIATQFRGPGSSALQWPPARGQRGKDVTESLNLSVERVLYSTWSRITL